MIELSSWNFETSRAKKISQNPYRFSGISGCLLILLFIFVILFSIGAAIYAAVQFANGEYLSPGMILFFCFAFLYLLISTIRTYRKTKDSIRTEELDSVNTTYSISETGQTTVNLNLGDFVCYKIKKRTVSQRGTTSSSSYSGTGSGSYWDLFLLKSDGSFYLLETYSSKDELKKNLILFRSIVSLPVSDDSKETNLKTSESTFKPSESAENGKTDSKFLKLDRTENGTEVELLKRKTTKEKITIALVAGIFYGVWAMIFFPITEAEPILLLFMIPFSILFLGIFTLGLVFVMTKSLKLTVNSSGLKIRYKTTLPILSNFLYSERFFPVHVMRHVRVNRLPGEQNILTIALKDSEKNKNETLAFLFNLQTISLNQYVLPGDRELLGIWHLMPWLPDSPGFADLIAAEFAIEEILRLNEEKIEFENS